ncbi:hypothetical protein IL992_24495 [Microbispora sp. NEAU-D428]|uniref:hypothetical protein n=1 Tax=Microbispora sitophila TaxID=2771537 RepID=UPI0018689721|nr:hypothetical protein [Microbispora sitophila]MBE3012327.1 hypothetical protein [Microbispora sitophila]
MKATKLAVLTMCLPVLLVGCTEERRPPSTNDEAKRRDAALVAVVQCLVDHDKIPPAHLKQQPWLRDTKVQPSAELVTWKSDHEETVYAGKTLQAWEDEATAGWPGWKCPW